MPRETRTLEPADILPPVAYAARRKEERARVSAQRRPRRVHVGPFVTFLFETWDTMWMQVQEMCWIERGGPEQIPDEIQAYDPMVPKGANLAATMLIEIDDKARRARELGRLGWIEDTVALRFAGQVVKADPDIDVDRTTPEGKTSSVHFLLFNFTPEQIALFRAPGTEVVLSIGHEHYRPAATLAEETRASLAGDFA